MLARFNLSCCFYKKEVYPRWADAHHVPKSALRKSRAEKVSRIVGAKRALQGSDNLHAGIICVCGAFASLV